MNKMTFSFRGCSVLHKKFCTFSVLKTFGSSDRVTDNRGQLFIHKQFQKIRSRRWRVKIVQNFSNWVVGRIRETSSFQVVFGESLPNKNFRPTKKLCLVSPTYQSLIEIKREVCFICRNWMGIKLEKEYASKNFDGPNYVREIKNKQKRNDFECALAKNLKLEILKTLVAQHEYPLQDSRQHTSKNLAATFSF